MLRGWVLVVLVAAPMLAGCADEEGLRGVEVTLTQSDVPIDANGQAAVRNVVCGERAIVAFEMSGYEQGSVSIVVKDGGAVPVFARDVRRSADAPFEEDIVGSQGTWTLQVHRTSEMDATFTLTFRC